MYNEKKNTNKQTKWLATSGKSHSLTVHVKGCLQGEPVFCTMDNLQVSLSIMTVTIKKKESVQERNTASPKILVSTTQGSQKMFTF